MPAWIGRLLIKDFQTFLSLARSLVTFPFLSFKSLLITSFHNFLGHLVGKVPLTMKILLLLDKALIL